MDKKIYDIHSHSGLQTHNIFRESSKVKLKKLSLEELLREYDERVDKIVNFPMPGTVYFNYEKINPINFKMSKYPYELENEGLLRAVQKVDKNEKILPFLCINPKIMVEEQLESLFKLKKKYSFFGLKFHTLDTGSGLCDLFARKDILAFCGEYNLPVIIHSGNFGNVEDCNDIFEYAKKYSHINFCIAHLMTFSEVFFNNLQKYKNGNVFTDISPFLSLCEYMCSWARRDSLKLEYQHPRKVLEFLLSRYKNFILWGSDVPFGIFQIDNEVYTKYDIKDELDFLYSLNKKDRDLIASINSEHFLFGKK